MHPGGRGGDPSTLPGVTEHPDESTGRPPSFLRSSMQEQARIARIRPLAPPSLLLRVGRWWWATVLLVLGGGTAVLGILYALIEDDMKRVLAYSTIENIGARRLQTVMERILDDISFSAPDKSGESIEIDADYVRAHISELARNTDLSRFIL